MKKILHIDADCFYAAIEMRENPELALVPLAVGGTPEKRGVVATCNYEARKYGVHSAMSSSRALQLCPHLHFLPPRIQHYKQYSQTMRDIFAEYSDKVEPLSLDEAYLDLSDTPHLHGSATLIAQEIRHRIYQELSISVSAGVAPVKFLAKIASDWNKPNGIFTLPPNRVENFLSNLALKKLPGVGPVARKKLERNGLYTCGDVQKIGLDKLVKLFGVHGSRLKQMSYGIDEREVAAYSQRKSVSVERTYSEDIPSLTHLLPCLPELMLQLEGRIEAAKAKSRVTKAFIKLKFCDFRSTTMESRIAFDQHSREDLFRRLTSAAWQRKKLPVRLLGVGVRLGDFCEEQMAFDFSAAPN